jgi:hypothetical protein
VQGYELTEDEYYCLDITHINQGNHAIPTINNAAKIPIDKKNM